MKPEFIMSGQRWQVPGFGVCQVMAIDLESCLASLIVKKTKERIVLPFNTLSEAKFLGGSKTPEEELSFIADRERQDVPEGVEPERWALIIQAAVDQLYQMEHDQAEAAPELLRSSLRTVRLFAPLFVRPLSERE